jgi:hypothetical protein
MPDPDPLIFLTLAVLTELEKENSGLIQRSIDRIEKGRRLTEDVVRLRFWPMGPQVKWSEAGALALLKGAQQLVAARE